MFKTIIIGHLSSQLRVDQVIEFELGYVHQFGSDTHLLAGNGNTFFWHLIIYRRAYCRLFHDHTL